MTDYFHSQKHGFRTEKLAGLVRAFAALTGLLRRAATDQEPDTVVERYNFDQDADGSASQQG